MPTFETRPVYLAKYLFGGAYIADNSEKGSIMNIFKHMLIAAVFSPLLVFGGYSPQTHFSTDDCNGDDERPWHHHKTIEEHYEALEISDPTYELEDSTMYPGQREDVSDMLFR